MPHTSGGKYKSKPGHPNPKGGVGMPMSTAMMSRKTMKNPEMKKMMGKHK